MVIVRQYNELAPFRKAGQLAPEWKPARAWRRTVVYNRAGDSDGSAQRGDVTLAGDPQADAPNMFTERMLLRRAPQEIKLMWKGSRRDFLATGSGVLAAAGLGLPARAGVVQKAGRQDQSIEVMNPQGRVPLSFIIDDSTCLVNMGHFCTPQFAEAWPTRDVYKKPWKKWPREIPDAFVREFGEWCSEHGVKGKYSVVPNPACVGWLDRELPGWSRRELLESLRLVRDLLLPNWDIHPEMITHTRVIDLKTGRPMEEISPATMENSDPRVKKSVDHLAAYLAYALKILKNCELPCEGITTPGGFGNLVKSELSLAVQQSVRDV